MRTSDLHEHPLSCIVPDMREPEWEAFIDDVAIRGVVEPLVILPDGTVLDGRHRLQAAHQLGLIDLPVRVIEMEPDAAQEYMIKAALLRRHLTDDQRAVLARKWQAARSAKVKKARSLIANAARWFSLSDTVSDKENDTREQAADMFAVAQRKVKYAGELERQAPDLLTQVERGEITLLEAKREMKERAREHRREKNRELVEAAVPVITASYPTIVIDPPWDWGDECDCDQFGRARPTYATMTIDQIAALPIADLAAANAHIYLWITNRSLPKGLGLLEQWGFRYVTCLTWCKPSIGMGNYYRGSTEHVLFAVRGTLGLLRHDVGTWFTAPRPGQHSAKPPEFYEIVETCSPGPWLDMFARRSRPGWTSWGAEVT